MKEYKKYDEHFRRKCKKDCPDKCPETQRHNHEFLGSTMIAAPENQVALLHNHRFAGITGPARGPVRTHVHVVCTNTDFFFNHFHRIETITGPPIQVTDKDGEVIGHTHAINGTTTVSFRHTHDFKANMLIQNPINGPLMVSEKEEWD